jgi:phosphoenolpyruvate carboxykinase (ATP)
MMTYVQDKELYVLDAWGGADPAYRIPVRIVTEFAWHNLFVRNMFIPELDPEKRASHRPEYTVIDCPVSRRTPCATARAPKPPSFVHYGRKLVLIAGTEYAGEMKKSIFTILNYQLPLKGVLSMHCSANVGTDGDAALFFGLSGTGKTTLSSDPNRGLIGDDEHGWSDRASSISREAATPRSSSCRRRPNRRYGMRHAALARSSRTLCSIQIRAK